MKLFLKGSYTIIGSIKSDPEDGKFLFKLTIDENKDISVTIIPNTNSIEVEYEVEISYDLGELLKSGKIEASEITPELDEEIAKIYKPASQAAQKVTSFIKYWLLNIDIDEGLISIKGIFWSLDRKDWKPLPLKGTASLSIIPIKSLNEDSATTLQEYLEINREPFLALRYIQRAIKENYPPFKWIDATIAAELAIKEFIIRLNPEIETLLLEVPSPPLHILYGSILESFTNERSPKLKEIAKGVEIRNQLVHKPIDIQISIDEANEYIQDIRIAIYHLLGLLYPDDKNIKYIRDTRRE